VPQSIKKLIMANRILSALLLLMTCVSANAASPRANNTGNTPIPLLRLKMSLDAFNSDDIAIGFLSTATTAYNNNLDSRYFPGQDAAEGLFSLSSDNVPLSVNVVPLPATSPLVIRLDVEAAASGTYSLDRTELDSIPAIYDVWLMDKFAKDSLNLRTATDYSFNINKADSTSFGNTRFQVVIRQNPLQSVHLLNFDALDEAGEAKVMWTTENEQDNTQFTVQRSIDNGATFYTLDTLTSTGAGSYTYTDKTPITGSDLYRLKVVDLNGTITYSNIVTLSFVSQAAQAEAAIAVYPNPSNGIINLAINPNGGNSTPTVTTAAQGTASVRSYATPNTASAANYAIKIINIRGAIMRSAVSSSTTWQDNLTSLSPGTYVVEVVNNGNNRVVGRSTFVKL